MDRIVWVWQSECFILVYNFIIRRTYHESLVLLEQEQWDLVSHRLLHRQKAMKYIYDDINDEFAANGKNKIAKGFEKRIAKGKMDQDKADAILAKIYHRYKRHLYRC